MGTPPLGGWGVWLGVFRTLHACLLGNIDGKHLTRVLDMFLPELIP